MVMARVVGRASSPCVHARPREHGAAVHAHLSVALLLRCCSGNGRGTWVPGPSCACVHLQCSLWYFKG